MTTRDITIGVYVLIVLSAVVLDLVGRRRDSTVPTFGEVISVVTGTMPGRLALLATWWWLGWHFLARSSMPPVDG